MTKALESVLSELHNRQFNPAYRLEPVGSVVLILMTDGQIRKAYRKSPIESKECPKTYFDYDTGEIITQDHVGWSYY